MPKKMMGAATRGHPSLGMTMTKTLRPNWIQHDPLVIEENLELYAKAMSYNG